MAVYVDTMRAKFGRMTMCHMVADTDDELRTMARRIGVAQKWHQGDHFDICLTKRRMAVERGAIEITWRQTGAMSYLQKIGQPMGDPETAIERMLAAKAEQSGWLPPSDHSDGETQ